MAELDQDVVTAIQSIQSEADFQAADDRVKEALRTYEVSDPDVVPEAADVIDAPGQQPASEA